MVKLSNNHIQNVLGFQKNFLFSYLYKRSKKQTHIMQEALSNREACTRSPKEDEKREQKL